MGVPFEPPGNLCVWMCSFAIHEPNRITIDGDHIGCDTGPKTSTMAELRPLRF